MISDIVFFIFLYQRWIYRVDPKRVNEFGTSGEDHKGPMPLQSGNTETPHEVQNGTGSENSGAQSEAHENVTKTSEEKKND